MNLDDIHRFVCPIWGRLHDSSRPELLGSGVLIYDGYEHLLLTAGHVMAKFDQGYRMGIWGPEILFSPRGLSFKFVATAETRGGTEDIFDFGGLFLDAESAALAKDHKDFLPLDQLSGEQPIEGSLALLFGYPVTRSKSSDSAATNEGLMVRSSVVSSERFPKTCYSERDHIFLDFNRKKGWLDDSGAPVSAPEPHGMSGGGIFVHQDPKDPSSPLKLVGIITEWHRDRKQCILGGTGLAFIVRRLQQQYAGRWGSLGKIV